MLILASDFPLIFPSGQLLLGFPSPKLCIHILYSHLNIFLCALSWIYCNLYKLQSSLFCNVLNFLALCQLITLEILNAVSWCDVWYFLKSCETWCVSVSMLRHQDDLTLAMYMELHVRCIPAPRQQVVLCQWHVTTRTLCTDAVTNFCSESKLPDLQSSFEVVLSYSSWLS